MTVPGIKDFGSRNLDAIVLETRRLYSAADSKRLVWDLWFHTCHHVAALVKSIRNDADPDTRSRELADSALWLFTFVGRASEPALLPEAGEQPSLQTLVKVSGTLSDLLWLRYPGACPGCIEQHAKHGGSQEVRECRCEPSSADQVASPEALRELQQLLRRTGADRMVNRPGTIDAWQDWLVYLFQRFLREGTQHDLGFLLAEQVGFVSDTIVRLYSYTESKPPTNDEVSWRRVWFEFEIARLTSLLFLTAGKDADRLSTIIGRRYAQLAGEKMSCPYCKQSECGCKIIIAPFDISVLELRERMAG